MDPNRSSSNRRRRDVPLTAESLESRNLMTAGAGNTFAIVPGTVTANNGVTAIKFTIDPKHFTIPKGKISLGLDVVAQPGSTAKPQITKIIAPDGKPVAGLTRSVYDTRLKDYRAANGSTVSAVIAPLKLAAKTPATPQTFTVMVNDKGKAGGAFLLGFYLPGDAKGTGKVDAASVATVKKALNANAAMNNGRYLFDADANRDGRIGLNDLTVTQQNLGVSTTVSPVVSATLDPATVSSVQDRVTRSSSVKFDGVATPGALIKFEETSNKVTNASIFADAKGNYNLTVPVAPGANTFRVTTQDAFGQSISGTIAPVNYITTAPVTTASTFSSLTPDTKIVVTQS